MLLISLELAAKRLILLLMYLQKKRTFLEKATCVHSNLYLFGPCKPEMAELLFPWCESFSSSCFWFADLVLVDTTTASTDC